MLTRVIFNQKGGVGKSSIAVNLAALSAKQGHATLLIDLDPQANASQYILGQVALAHDLKQGLEPNIEQYFQELLSSSTAKGLLGHTFGQLLKTRGKGLEDYRHSSAFARLDVIPASPNLGALTTQLETKHKIYKLRDAIQQLEGRYTRIYIDTPPAFNFFSLSALIAADRVLIPFDCDVFAERALQTLIDNVFETQADHNQRLEIEGIIVNQYQAQAKLSREMVHALKKQGLPVLENMLPASVIMKASHQHNMPLIHFDARHKLTQAYQSLFNEIERQAS